jgi:hypothetical protein
LVPTQRFPPMAIFRLPRCCPPRQGASGTTLVNLTIAAEIVSACHDHR